MSSDRHLVPASPRFWDDLEAQLRLSVRRRRRLPAATSALRALREFGGYALHAALATGVAAGLLLTTPGPPAQVAPDPSPAVTSPARGAPYRAVSAQTILDRTREFGFEVEVVRAYVTDPRAHGEVLGVNHLGSSYDTVPSNLSARGPVLVVVGMAISDRGVIAG